MSTKLIIGIIILIICCILAFLIPLAPPGKILIQDDGCNDEVCPPPKQYKRIIDTNLIVIRMMIGRSVEDMLDWFLELTWYFKAAIVGVIAYLIYWFGFK